MRTGKKAAPIEGRYTRKHCGAPSTLTVELTTQIVGMARNGHINQEIIDTLGFPSDTFYTWIERNTNDLKDRIADARRSYLLDMSEQQLTKLANSKNERIKLQAVMYLSETLGKRWYSKREEHKVIEDGEGVELEPENKEKLDKLLAQNPAPSVVSPLQSKDIKE